MAKQDRRALKRWNDASMRAVADAKPYVPQSKATSSVKIDSTAKQQPADSEADKFVLDQHQQDVVNMCMDRLGIFDEGSTHDKENKY